MISSRPHRALLYRRVLAVGAEAERWARKNAGPWDDVFVVSDARSVPSRYNARKYDWIIITPRDAAEHDRLKSRLRYSGACLDVIDDGERRHRYVRPEKER